MMLNVCLIVVVWRIKTPYLFQCNFYGQLWNLISGWLSFSTVHHGNIFDHLLQFGGLEGFSKNSRLAFNII